MEDEDDNDLLTDWENLLLSSSSTPHFHCPPSVDPFLSIFPPVNHEGLPLPIYPHQPPPSTPPPPEMATHHRNSPISPLPSWIAFALRLFHSKFASALSNLRSWVLMLSFPSSELMAGASLVGLGVWLWWRRRRRRWSGGSRDDSIQRLNVLAREKDEIIELLNEVVQLNKLLLARYRGPVGKEC